MSKERGQALTYLAQALQEYAQTMPPSVRGPFQAEVQRAFQIIDPPAEKPSESHTP